MTRLLWIVLAAPLAIAQDAAREDVITLADGSEVRGRLQDLQDGQTLTVKQSARTVRLPIEEVSRIQCAAPATPPPAAEGAKIHLEHGAVLTGTVTALADRRITVETVHGPLAVEQDHVVRIVWNAGGPAIDKVEEGKDAVLVAAGGAVKESAVEWGFVTRLDPEMLTLKKGEDEIAIARSAVSSILFARLRPPSPAQSGWFARVSLWNGDRLVGVLKAVRPEQVELFSHILGTVTIARASVQALQFTPTARVFVGNMLICDQGSVREYGPQGTLLWTYQKDLAFPICAVRMDSGNVLVASYNGNKVVEIRPKRPVGGDVVWQSDQVQNPYDVQSLAQGRILVVASNENAVVEIDVRTKKRVWTATAVTQPIRAQRLDNGNTLITSPQCVVEIDANQKEIWRASLPGLQPWRATRLENGNTLIVESNNNRVVEVTTTKPCRVVQKIEGLSHPSAAVRLDDGRTLVVESEQGRVMQFDTGGGAGKPLLQRLNYPNNLSVY